MGSITANSPERKTASFAEGKKALGVVAVAAADWPSAAGKTPAPNRAAPDIR
jgi:hypothetical protein